MSVLERNEQDSIGAADEVAGLEDKTCDVSVIMHARQLGLMSSDTCVYYGIEQACGPDFEVRCHFAVFHPRSALHIVELICQLQYSEEFSEECIVPLIVTSNDSSHDYVAYQTRKKCKAKQFSSSKISW